MLNELLEEFKAGYGVSESGHPWPVLVREEINELWEAFRCGTAKEQLKESCDVIYVLIGHWQQQGVDIEQALREVHRSNMSKLGEDGKPIKREDGKIMKGPNYRPPDFESMRYNRGQ